MKRTAKIGHGKRFRLAIPKLSAYVVNSNGECAMSTGPNRILDEFAKLMTDAAGAAQGVRREMEGAFRSQAERLLNSMDIVQREEFEAAREMATKARAENKKLAKIIEGLEQRIAVLEGNGTSEASDSGTKRSPKPGAKK